MFLHLDVSSNMESLEILLRLPGVRVKVPLEGLEGFLVSEAALGIYLAVLLDLIDSFL